jgi:Fic family protein
VKYNYDKSSWRNLSFFESYFSNYLEGTEFEIDEAECIVFSNKIIQGRHKDSHDVMAVFDIIHDYQEMSVTPESADELISLIQQRHQRMMQERDDKRPGVFKEKANKAGSTHFVLPNELIGTLTQGFDIYQTVESGLKRAIFMQFLITECHPFDDGNGRLSRIMMNAELHAAGLHKLIVPTVHRDSYLNGLRRASRSNGFRAQVKIFHQ